MILHTVVVYYCGLDHWTWKFAKIIMSQRLETKAHRLQVEPKFAADEVAVMTLTFIGPVHIQL